MAASVLALSLLYGAPVVGTLASGMSLGTTRNDLFFVFFVFLHGALASNQSVRARSKKPLLYHKVKAVMASVYCRCYTRWTACWHVALLYRS